MDKIFEVMSTMAFGEHRANYVRVNFTEKEKDRILELQAAAKKVGSLYISDSAENVEVVEDNGILFEEKEDFEVEACRLMVTSKSFEYVFVEKNGSEEYCTEPCDIAEFLNSFNMHEKLVNPTEQEE